MSTVTVSWRRCGAEAYPCADLHRDDGTVVTLETRLLHRRPYFYWTLDAGEPEDREAIAAAIREAAERRGYELLPDEDLLDMKTWRAFWRMRSEVALLVDGAELNARGFNSRDTVTDDDGAAVFARAKRGE